MMFNIQIYPSANLSCSTRPVELFDQSLGDLIKYMTEEMYSKKGIGLAANQIGSNKSVIIIDISEGESADCLMVMINPILKYEGKKILSKEGCLSVPGVSVEVKRFETCHVVYQDSTGVFKTDTLSGLKACVVQHEVDHLHGLTILDRIPIRKRKKLLKEYRCENQ